MHISLYIYTRKYIERGERERERERDRERERESRACAHAAGSCTEHSGSNALA